MNRGSFRKLVAAALVLMASLVMTAGGQDKQEAKKKGRLPAYYADIVTDAQRQQIYAVQEKYAKTLTALQDQIDTIEKQRDAEIEGVLDAQQKARLKAVKADAVARKAKAAAEKKAAEVKGSAKK